MHFQEIVVADVDHTVTEQALQLLDRGVHIVALKDIVAMKAVCFHIFYQILRAVPVVAGPEREYLVFIHELRSPREHIVIVHKVFAGGAQDPAADILPVRHAVPLLRLVHLRRRHPELHERVELPVFLDQQRRSRQVGRL